MKYLNTLQRILGHPLNRGRSSQALAGFLSWHIGSRLAPGPVAVPFVNQTALLIRPGMSGATQNVYCGLNDFEEMSFLLHLLRPEDLFIDIGANVGVYTVLASGVLGARTVAFEPNPDTATHLRKNILLNDIDSRVEVHRCALGSQTGHVRFSISGPDAMHHVERPSDDPSTAIETPLRRLDDILAGPHPVLLKMDVEGYETEVLAGAAATLADPTLLAVITESTEDARLYGQDTATPHRLLTARGFRRAEYDPARRRLLFANSDAAPGNIYLRNENEVLDRIAAAPRFQVRGQSF